MCCKSWGLLQRKTWISSPGARYVLPLQNGFDFLKQCLTTLSDLHHLVRSSFISAGYSHGVEACILVSPGGRACFAVPMQAIESLYLCLPLARHIYCDEEIVHEKAMQDTLRHMLSAHIKSNFME